MHLVTTSAVFETAYMAAYDVAVDLLAVFVVEQFAL